MFQDSLSGATTELEQTSEKPKVASSFFAKENR